MANDYFSGMNKRFYGVDLGLAVLLLSGTTLVGQSVADSILAEVATNVLPEARLTMLDSACAQALRSEEVDMDTLFISSLQLGEAVEGVPANARRAVTAARYFAEQGKEGRGLEALQPYYENREAIIDLTNKVKVIATYGNLLTNSFSYEPAIAAWKEVLDIYESGAFSASSAQWGRANIDLGKNYFSIGKYGEASVHLNRAKEFYRQANDSLGLKFSHNELGNLYGRIALYDEAIRQFREMERYDAKPSKVTVGFQAANIGRSYLEEDRYVEALTEYHRGMAVRPFTADDAYIELYLINGIIECHYYLETQDSVRQYVEELEAAYAREGSDVFYDFLLLQSRFFAAVLDKNYPWAEQLLTTLYNTSVEYANDAELVAYSGYFADLYRRWGKYDKALAYQDTHTRITDSIRAANKTHALVLYQTEYETKEKEQQIQVLEAENELQLLQARTNRNRFIFGGLGLCVLFGGLLMRQYFRNKVDRALRVERLRDKISRDLHDDVGSILTGLAMKTELLTETLPEQHRAPFGEVTDLSRSAMYRMRDAVWIMDSSRDNWKSLKERIQEFAYEILTPKDIGFQLMVTGTKDDGLLDGEVRQHLYLITKEAITNAVKHAPDATKVTVNFQQSATGLILSIQNDGVVEASSKLSAGSGMRNMQQRAKELGGSLVAEVEGDAFKVVYSGPVL
ncbi:MAG: histidine kinase [Bacteroidota bacterium]